MNVQRGSIAQHPKNSITVPNGTGAVKILGGRKNLTVFINFFSGRNLLYRLSKPGCVNDVIFNHNSVTV
jgi:hypothetical protein